MLPHATFQPHARAALSGLRVLDLSRLVAGNMASLPLADHGAEVVKIEDPVKGDPLRWPARVASGWLVATIASALIAGMRLQPPVSARPGWKRASRSNSTTRASQVDAVERQLKRLH